MRLARAGFVGEFVGFVLARAFRFSGEEEGAGGEAVVRLEFADQRLITSASTLAAVSGPNTAVSFGTFASVQSCSTRPAN
nr:hypothetical protein [Hoylesella enoeca]